MNTFPRVIGYCAAWGARFELPSGLHVARRGALKPIRDVKVTVAHSLRLPVSERPRFKEDSIGLLVTIRLADSALSRLLVDAMANGTFTSMSYTFDDPQKRTLWARGHKLMEIVDAGVNEVCVTDWPRQMQAACRLASRPYWTADSRAYDKLVSLLREKAT